ncbi:hypothetical protein CGT78_08505 [Vibrio cholerae]|nr:hypothetical protein CGT78_08505 [Vibrio cholerae]
MYCSCIDDIHLGICEFSRNEVFRFGIEYRKQGVTTIAIPFLLEAAAVLAALTHPNHIVDLCSWG